VAAPSARRSLCLRAARGRWATFARPPSACSSPFLLRRLVASTGGLTASRLVRSTSPAEPVSRLLTVSYHSLTSSTWDADPALIGSDDVNADSAPLRTSQYEAPAPQPLFPHPLAGMKKILEAGSFFFADGGSWDLSSRVEERLRRAGEGDAGVSLEETGEQACDEDRRFVWNQFLLSGLRDFAAELEDDERAELDAWGVIVRLGQRVAAFEVSMLMPIGDRRSCLSSKASCRRQRSRCPTSRRA
jgi:hypothetical protein